MVAKKEMLPRHQLGRGMHLDKREAAAPLMARTAGATRAAPATCACVQAIKAAELNVKPASIGFHGALAISCVTAARDWHDLIVHWLTPTHLVSECTIRVGLVAEEHAARCLRRIDPGKSNKSLGLKCLECHAGHPRLRSEAGEAGGRRRVRAANCEISRLGAATRHKRECIRLHQRALLIEVDKTTEQREEQPVRARIHGAG